MQARISVKKKGQVKALVSVEKEKQADWEAVLEQVDWEANLEQVDWEAESEQVDSVLVFDQLV